MSLGSKPSQYEGNKCLKGSSWTTSKSLTSIFDRMICIDEFGNWDRNSFSFLLVFMSTLFNRGIAYQSPGTRVNIFSFSLKDFLFFNISFCCSLSSNVTLTSRREESTVFLFLSNPQDILQVLLKVLSQLRTYFSELCLQSILKRSKSFCKFPIPQKMASCASDILSLPRFDYLHTLALYN